MTMEAKITKVVVENNQTYVNLMVDGFEGGEVWGANPQNPQIPYNVQVKITGGFHDYPRIFVNGLMKPISLVELREPVKETIEYMFEEEAKTRSAKRSAAIVGAPWMEGLIARTLEECEKIDNQLVGDV